MFDIKVEKLSKGLDFLSIDYDHNLIHDVFLICQILANLLFFDNCEI